MSQARSARKGKLNAADIMTRNVATVGPDTTLDVAIRLMIEKRASGLPVLDSDKRLVGILTEGDLLRRVELDTEKHRPRWLEFLIAPGRHATEYVGTHSRRVGDVMTEPVLSVEDTTPLNEIVAIMQRKHVKRLPVMKNGQVVGVVSRADMIRAMIHATPRIEVATTDPALRDQVLAELKRQDWGFLTGIRVTVDQGVVDLDGVIMDERERDAIRVAAENVPGVKAVRSNLVWVEPNTGECFGAGGSLA